MITQSFTDLEKAVTMLNRESEVKDLPNPVVWCPKEKEVSCDVVFRNVSFHYKVSSQRRPLGTALDEPSGERPGRGKHGGRIGRLALGFVDEGEANQNKPGDGGEEEIIKLGGVDNVNLRIAAGSTVALVGSSGKKCRVSFS